MIYGIPYREWFTIVDMLRYPLCNLYIISIFHIRYIASTAPHGIGGLCLQLNFIHAQTSSQAETSQCAI